MPPSYESETFWDTRFKAEKHFEWLDDGQNTVIPVLRGYLQAHAQVDRDPAEPPLVLHIGAGTSTLSNGILEEYHRAYKGPFEGPVVLNTDFAQEAVRRGKEAAEGSPEVDWARLDLLEWTDIRALGEKTVQTRGRRFAFVVDKSTTDAVSCREDMVFSRQTCGGTMENCHPAVVDAVVSSPAGAVAVHPVAVLAHHVASLVEPGGVWIALSYSSNRFPFLTRGAQEQENDVERRVGEVWELERVEAVSAKEEGSAAGPSVHTPEVFHYLYILRRLPGVVSAD